jgi:3-hydroxybutyrate dehydrogenase
VANLRKSGAKDTFYHGADMGKSNEIIDMMKQTLSKYGKIDILINNAGIQNVAPIDEFPDEKWEQIIRINLTSCFYTIKHALPSMKQNGKKN